jgi:multiple RNA-binding domain-containing protein 1
VADGTSEGIEQTGRLFVRNLSYGATEADLMELFSAHGVVDEAHLVLDK